MTLELIDTTAVSLGSRLSLEITRAALWFVSSTVIGDANCYAVSWAKMNGQTNEQMEPGLTKEK